jgi:hypothetical protein
VTPAMVHIINCIIWQEAGRTSTNDMAKPQDQKTQMRYMLFVILLGENIISQIGKLNYATPLHKTTDSQNISI